MDDTQKVGAKIKAARKKAGLTQEQLAEMVGVSKPTICRYETGSGAAPNNILYSIANALNISPVSLLGWKETSWDRLAAEFEKEAESYQDAMESLFPNIHIKAPSVNDDRERIFQIASDYENGKLHAEHVNAKAFFDIALSGLLLDYKHGYFEYEYVIEDEMWSNILNDFRDFASDYFHRRIQSAESLGKAYCLSSKTLRLPYGNYGDPVWYPSIEDFLTPEELEQKHKEESGEE